MKRTNLILLMLILVALMLRGPLPTATGVASERPLPTPTSVDLYGASLGFDLRVGDVVSVRSASGLLCGSSEVTTPGYYGMLHVYGDDPTTPRLDGALPGEALEVEVNGQPVTPEGGNPVWTRDGDRLRVNLAR